MFQKFGVDSDPNMLDLISQQQLFNTKPMLINFGDISASIFKNFHLFSKTIQMKFTLTQQ